MATVALSTLRSQLQTFLRDTDAKKWTATDLDSFINLAITQWTTDLPIATSVDYAVVSGQHAYDVPSNAVSVKWVRGYFENSSNLEFIGPMSVEPGTWASLDEPRRFILQFPTETQFYLPRLPSGSAFTLYYGATHDPLAGDGAVLNLRNQRWGELAVLATGEVIFRNGPRGFPGEVLDLLQRQAGAAAEGPQVAAERLGGGEGHTGFLQRVGAGAQGSGVSWWQCGCFPSDRIAAPVAGICYSNT